MTYENIKEDCEIMLKILAAFENVDKGEVNDLSNDFDTCKEDLIKSLEEVE